MAAPGEITALLQAHLGGDPDAIERLLACAYGELRSIARARLRHEAAGHTLAPTELVHQAFLKLIPLDRVDWRSRAHFYAIASRAMRQVLVDHAERRDAAKRGGRVQPITLDRVEGSTTSREVALDDLLALEQALQKLQQLDARQARVVECRFFGGLSLDETAEALSISPATVSRDWTFARAWLHRELSVDAAPAERQVN